MKRDYSYQIALIEDVCRRLEAGRRVVLAACPSAGKTRMALEIISRFIKARKIRNSLILTHGQILLRDQWHGVTIDHCVSHTHRVVRRKRDLAKNRRSQITLALPQTIHRSKIKKIDFLVTDEVHQRYFAKQVQLIRSRLKPRYELLLTGTPSAFVGNPDFDVTGITIEEILDSGTVVDPLIEIVQSDYDYHYSDFDKSTRSLRGRKLGKPETETTLDKLLPQIIAKLISAHRTQPELYDWAHTVTSWEGVMTRLKKTMIIANDQSQAKDIGEYLEKKGVRFVLSISDLNRGSAEVESFKSDKSIPVFIVVNRGIIGFNYTELMNIIDLSGTLNVNRIFQSLCRIIRPPDENQRMKKLYIKATNKELSYMTYFVMSFAVALSTKRHFYTYKTESRTDRIAVPTEFVKAIKDLDKDGRPGIEKAMPDLPTLLTFNELKDISSTSKTRSIAYTDLKTVIERVYQKKEIWNIEKIFALAKGFKTRNAFHKKYPGASGFLRTTGQQSILDELFGKKFRWTEQLALERLGQCKNVSELKNRYGGAYRLLKKNGTLASAASSIGTPLKQDNNDSKTNRAIQSILKDPDVQILDNGSVLHLGKPINTHLKYGKPYWTYHRVHIPLHRLVYWRFFGQPPKRHYIMSKGDHQQDLHPDNLIAATPLSAGCRQNKTSDAARQNCKINLRIAKNIRRDREAGMKYSTLVEKYKLSKSSISYLLNGKTWVE